MPIYTVFWDNSKRAASFTDYKSAHGLFFLLKSAGHSPVLAGNVATLKWVR